MAEKFDFEAYKAQAVKDLLAGKSIGGPEGVLTPLLKQVLEAALEAEVKHHVSRGKEAGEVNRRNGRMKKQVRSMTSGTFEVETPRDRAGTFEPQVLGKRQVYLGADLEEKILLLYARGLSYDDISAELKQIYGVDASPALLSEVTDRVVPLLEEWRQRPLAPVYAFVFLDAMHFRVRGSEGRVENRMLYLVYGLTPGGQKEILGIYLAQTEGAKFWLQVLDDLKRRGVEDILIASVDGLKGFEEVIRTYYPDAAVQQCIVHQLRHSFRFVSDKDLRAFAQDLKPVYQAPDRAAGEAALDALDARWGQKYAPVILSWRQNWPRLSTYFDFPACIRKVMYTTNPIEGVNRRVRKVTKTKGAFPSEQALLKLVYLVVLQITKKWTVRPNNWGEIAGALHVLFPERLKLDLRT